jgi:hypothetical protein
VFWHNWRAKYLAPDAHIWYKLWSVRVALFGGLLAGLWVALPALQSYVSPVEFGSICVGYALTFVVARLVNQPGFGEL